MASPHGTALESLYVDLPEVEDVASRHHGVDEVDLPIIARNLFPRLVVPRERLLESSIHILNIDQSVVAACDLTRGKGVRACFLSDRQLRSATSSQNSF